MKKLILILFLMAGCSSQNLPQVTGNIVQKSHVNDPRTALYEEFVPRDASGTVTDIAGGLGTASFRWDDSFIKGITIGTAVNGNSITESVGKILLTGLKDASVDGKFLIDATVDRGKIKAVGQQVSSSSGSYETGSATYVDVTNLSVTITTVGRPVVLMMVADGSGIAEFGNKGLGGGGEIRCYGNVKALRDAVNIYEISIASHVSNVFLAVANSYKTPPSMLDHPSSGTYIYKIQAKDASPFADCRMRIANIKLIAYEL